MNMSQYWSADEQAWIMPALWELQNDGSVDRADDWSTLKTEVTQKLAEYGAESAAGSLVAPLDSAVHEGADFKDLIAELNIEYQVAAVDDQPDDETTEFTATLPDPTELAEQIVLDLGREIGALIAANPDLAKVSDEELLAWVTEDVEAAIDEIAEAGWVV